MKHKLLFICGGSWSGKTARATKLASQSRDVVWIGTAVQSHRGANDHVDALKAKRPAAWVTLDEPFDLVTVFNGALKKHPDCLIVIDSLSQWLSNQIAKLSMKHDEHQLAKALMRDVEELCSSLNNVSGSVIVVASDFGASPPPQDPALRILRMCTGNMNQAISQLADEVEIMMAGVVLSAKTETL